MRLGIAVNKIFDFLLALLSPFTIFIPRMAEFIVSARKYRPATFDTVVGQQAIVTTLKNAIAKGQLAHAYLFCGSRGVGKTTTARILAKTINCQNPGADGEACGHCESCRAFDEGRSFNIHELDAASNNSVDDIRSLIEQVRIPPQIGKYCVYIIDEVHMLSTAAFNAFLKTLEEPPSYAIFILATTEKQKILPTIISRCQVFDFNRIGVEDIVAHLQGIAAKEGIKADADALNVIAVKSDGGMRDALSTFDHIASFAGDEITYKDVIDNLNILDYDYFFRFVDMFRSGDVQSALLLYDEILSKGFDGQNFVSGLLSHLRDLLVSKDGKTAPLLQVGANIRKRYMEQSSECDIRSIFAAMEIVNAVDIGYKQSRNKRLSVELMLIRLCQMAEQKKNKQPVAEEKPQLQPLQPLADAAAAQKNPAVQKEVAAPRPVAQPVQAHRETVKPAQPGINKAARNAFGGIGFSLKSLMDDNDGQQSRQSSAVRLRETVFSEEQLNSAWFSLPDEIPEKLMLHRFFSVPPILENGKTVMLKVENELVADELQQVLPLLTKSLRNRLDNDTVEISVYVEAVATEEKLTTNDAKLKYLVEKNGELQNLVSELGMVFD